MRPPETVKTDRWDRLTTGPAALAARRHHVYLKLVLYEYVYLRMLQSFIGSIPLDPAHPESGDRCDRGPEPAMRTLDFPPTCNLPVPEGEAPGSASAVSPSSRRCRLTHAPDCPNAATH